jgi:hypothetical protein
MMNLTLKQLEDKVSEPILIDNYVDKDNIKAIEFHPIDQQYKIYMNYEEVNSSYLAETAIEYYNNITF